MNHYRRTFLIVLATLQAALPAVAASSFQAGQTLFIFHDFAEVRESPSKRSPVVARLRVNTPVEAVSRRGSWTRVSHASTSRGVSGYVRSEALSEAPLAYADAMKRARAALKKRPRTAVTWGERALAVSAGGPDEYLATLRFLERAYRKAGRKTRAKRTARAIRDLENGNKDLWIAACLPKKISHEPVGAGHRIVALVHSTAEGMRPLTPSGTGGSILTELESALPLLGAETWFAITPNGAAALPGTPFLNASIVDSRATGPFADTPKIVLGACDEPGTIYSNRPLSQAPWVDAKPEEKVNVERALGRYFEPGFDFAITPPIGSRYTTLAQTETFILHQGFIRHVHPHLEKTIGIWGLFRPQSSAPLYQAGKYESPDSYSSVHAAIWVQSDWGPATRFGVFPYRLHSQGGGAGERVLILRLGPGEATQSLDCVIDIAAGLPPE